MCTPPRTGGGLPPEHRRACPKRSYPTRRDAELALLECRILATLHGHQQRRERRAYYCSRCRQFHLTSHPGHPVTPRDREEP
ncbi:hypothetical protein LZ318_30780 [Saccharopolyspora indica]|uniref:hypothetical protein n=1 Tax=Saccharopolyspora indica TaxID=1229659 RepID=UPI0022EA514F|nr:hypothetical protein [Saccharopolyspora indica]MDA3644382.1 hypothetical protein [Saccharopolyspora indica]